MQRSTDRILTTHVGSLVRPPVLRAMTEGVRDGSVSQETYEACLASSVAEVVRKQAECGIDIVNDGEFGKSSWAAYVLERISGFELRREQLRPQEWLGRDRVRFAEAIRASDPNYSGYSPTTPCTGPIRYQDNGELARDIKNLKDALEGVNVTEAFFTTVAPASTAYDGVNEYYDSDHDYVYAIADALREEYLAVHKAGFLVQVDDAVLANMYDALVQQSPQKYREWAELRVDALNHALRDIPEDRIRYHLCFGSWHVPHVADAELGDIVDLILRVKAGAYAIEAANVRHEHEWRVWEKVKLPEGRILIPGVVTHHTVSVEHPRLVADRILNFAKLVGKQNVIAGTDCGFAQRESIQRVHPQVVWAKFEALAEGARIASKELWG